MFELIPQQLERYFTSHVVIPRDENRDIASSTVILPTPITSI